MKGCLKTNLEGRVRTVANAWVGFLRGCPTFTVGESTLEFCNDLSGLSWDFWSQRPQRVTLGWRLISRALLLPPSFYPDLALQVQVSNQSPRKEQGEGIQETGGSKQNRNPDIYSKQQYLVLQPGSAQPKTY